MARFNDRADNGPPASEATVEEAPGGRNHGADVSAVAHAPDPTPETNHGADVSAAARANHGHDKAAGHRPDQHGRPAKPGKSRTHK